MLVPLSLVGNRAVSWLPTHRTVAWESRDLSTVHSDVCSTDEGWRARPSPGWSGLELWLPGQGAHHVLDRPL